MVGLVEASKGVIWRDDLLALGSLADCVLSLYITMEIDMQRIACILPSAWKC